jgi:hypothetical protein
VFHRHSILVSNRKTTTPSLGKQQVDGLPPPASLSPLPAPSPAALIGPSLEKKTGHVPAIFPLPSLICTS